MRVRMKARVRVSMRVRFGFKVRVMTVGQPWIGCSRSSMVTTASAEQAKFGRPPMDFRRRWIICD